MHRQAEHFACGLVAVAYHELIRQASKYMINSVLAVQGPSRVFWIFFVTVGGCLSAGLLLHFFFPDARGSGIPQVKIAYVMNYGKVPLRVARPARPAIWVVSCAARSRNGPTSCVSPTSLRSTTPRNTRK